MKAAERRGDQFAYVFAAACTGSAGLSERVGLPLVHIGVATDVAAAIRRLNEIEYGSGVRAPGCFQPILFDSHWADWDLFPYDLGHWRAAFGARPEGVRALEERIAVRLPDAVTIHAFREELRAALRHLRLHEVTTTAGYMAARSEALTDFTVHPRYTADPADRGFEGALRADDLYVIDPAESARRLFWMVAAARAAVIEERPP